MNLLRIAMNNDESQLEQNAKHRKKDTNTPTTTNAAQNHNNNGQSNPTADIENQVTYQEIDWSQYVDTSWDLYNNDDEYVFQRLTTAYEITATLSGFIGGFTFVVSNAESNFDNIEDGGKVVDPETRRQLFGFYVTLAFTSALVASMLSSSYLVLVNICGVHRSKHFVKEFYFEKNCLGCGTRYIAWTNVPWYLMNFSVFLMLVGVIFSVGGYYATWVFVPNLLYLLFLCALGFYMFNVMWHRLRQKDFGQLKLKQ